MQKYNKYHEQDRLIGNNPIPSNVEYTNVNSDNKTPFLSLPITKSCNHSCVYCGVAGEATASQSNHIELQIIMELVELAKQKGITKFRITGGEPFKHANIKEIFSFFNTIGCYILVNTNGSLLLENKEVLSVLNPDCFRFSVSLDTLKPKRFLKIAQPHNGKYEKYSLQNTLDGIEYLQSLQLLQRINMVVGKMNRDEVFDMIQFCQKHNCDLKLLDIVSVPVPFGEREKYHMNLTKLEGILRNKCDNIGTHNYTQSFGIPCFRYKFGNIFVTIKNGTKGSHYDSQHENGVCKYCSYFPCHEGLYDIFALSDGRICSCRWSEQQFYNEREQQLEFLIDAFKKSVFIKNAHNGRANMQSREDLRGVETKE